MSKNARRNRAKARAKKKEAQARNRANKAQRETPSERRPAARDQTRAEAPPPPKTRPAPVNGRDAGAHRDDGRPVLLEVRGVRTRFRTEAGLADAVSGIDFNVHEGEVLGIVGESGSGKSVLSLSIMRLIPNPPGEIYEGKIRFAGQDLLSLPWEEMRAIRGKRIAMIFQEPMTSLNPVYTIGFQIREILEHHEGLSRQDAHRRGAELLTEVGIPDALKRMDDYPHQFSGGMRQRAMIAMALACNPQLLIADEPTTALDVTIQAQILELMLRVKSRRKDAAIMLITHDLAVVAETCERVIVMYGGKIQEIAPVRELFKDPKHPYTKGLLASLPRPDQRQTQKRLATIPGMVPNIHNFPKGCRFSNRCDVVEDRCHDIEPALLPITGERWARCHLLEHEVDPAAVARMTV